jgi:hypothetical protein
MFYRYRYENEFYPTLSRIPLYVRMKLDLTGKKISLKDWLAFEIDERQALCHLPVDTPEEKRVFASYLDFVSRRHLGEAAASVDPMTNPPWEKLDGAPDSVQRRSRESGQPLTAEEWRGLNSCQRYALYKVSISKNEPEQFFDLLREFRESEGGKS